MKYVLLLATFTTLLLSNDDFSIETDFLDSLEEVSEIATKTKLNIDDAPSFVTVLHNEKLQKLGITNLFEALAQVPGVALKRESSGIPVVVFRGVSQKGEVKLMIDGVTVNNTYRGSIYYFFDFPIELIERIEVIRGAGSVLYGSGAISGVINVITKSASETKKNTLFVSGGTYDSYSGGAILSTTMGKMKVAVDTYYHTNKKVLDNTDRELSDFSLGLNIQKEELKFLARINSQTTGNAYGIFAVEDVSTHRYDNKNDTYFTQFSYKLPLGKKDSLEFLAGYSRYRQEAEALHPSLGVLTTQYDESTYFGQVDLKYNALEENELLCGLKYEAAKVLDSDLFREGSQIAPLVTHGLTRDILSIYLNDKYTLYRDLDISLGLRYDDYSDFESAFSPTLGFVYRATEKLRIKALYAEAFRAPSWIELTSNPNLQEETSTSYELGFVYKQNMNNLLRLNIYNTELNDMITKELTYVQSMTYATFRGIEMEYVSTPLETLEMTLLGSYIDAKDNENNAIADVANVLTSLSGIYTFSSGVSTSVLLKYVSSSQRAVTDPRDDMPSSTILDTTLSYSYKYINTSVIIKDLFDKGTYYALPLNSLAKDYYDGGRSIMFKAAWEF